MNEPFFDDLPKRSADFQSAVSPAFSRQDDGAGTDLPRSSTLDTAECNYAPPHSELLILPDGRILVHNLTPAFAELLHELNPEQEEIAARTRLVTHHASPITPHELPN